MSLVKYYNSNYLNVKNGGISAWQGIRYIDENIFLICGTTNPSPTTGIGIVYSGNISFTNGNIFYLNVPFSTSTSVYGPNYENGVYNFVGSFNQFNNLSITKGFIYSGSLDDESLNNLNNYSYPSVNNLYETVFIHSYKNDYFVGNSGNNNNTLSFLYNINNLDEFIEIKYPGSETTTSYGIWYDKKCNIYIIVGGYSKKKININDIYENRIPKPIGQNFIVFFDPLKNIFFNWTTLILPLNNILLSHIEGISGFDGLDDIFSLSIDVISLNSEKLGYYGVIVPDKENVYRIEQFVNINYPEGISTNNSVANNNVVGLSISEDENISFQAVIE